MNKRSVAVGCGGVALVAIASMIPGTLFALFSQGFILGGSVAELAPAADALYEMEAEPVAAVDGLVEEQMTVGRRAAPRSRPAAKAAPAAAAPPMARQAQAMDDAEQPQGAPSADAEAEARDWFPEAFLWAPRVETDSDGVASLDVRVPDSLTTWRVLALAHDRSGQQAGTVHTFDSRLPVYVEPVIPGWLYAGDVVELPVQAVNTSEEAVSGRLAVEASGAWVGGGEATVALSPGGSAVRRVRLATSGAGVAKVKASLLSDSAERVVSVLPAGRPVEQTVGGSLSSRRTLELVGPERADLRTQELTVRVFPGPLAVLQTELERVTATAGDGAYAFALASQIGALTVRAGLEVDALAIRRLQQLAWQRIAGEARAPDPGQAADLLLALREVEGHELAEALRPRLAHTLVEGQRGDGTWARQSSGTLQQVIVQTALASRALPDDRPGERLRAAGAIERYAHEIQDPYTAAMVLASGLAGAELAERLRELVVAGASQRADGSYTLGVPGNAQSAWGGRPSQAEMLAVGALALADSDVEWKGDLVAELMSRYDAHRGFGAGRADVLALEAVARLMPGADAPVEVSLHVEGKELARGTVDPSQPKVPAVLVAAPDGAERFELVLGSDAPGLAWSATLASWVPWTGEEALPGVEVEARLSSLIAGREGSLTLSVAAPSGASVTVEQGLPAGIHIDEERLASLSGMLTAWEVHPDRVRLTTRPFQAGEVMDLGLTVQPTFAGSFQTAPLTVTAGGRSEALKPLTWVVAGPRS